MTGRETGNVCVSVCVQWCGMVVSSVWSPVTIGERLPSVGPPGRTGNGRCVGTS